MPMDVGNLQITGTAFILSSRFFRAVYQKLSKRLEDLPNRQCRVEC